MRRQAYRHRSLERLIVEPFISRVDLEIFIRHTDSQLSQGYATQNFFFFENLHSPLLHFMTFGVKNTQLNCTSLLSVLEASSGAFLVSSRSLDPPCPTLHA